MSDTTNGNNEGDTRVMDRLARGEGTSSSTTGGGRDGCDLVGGDLARRGGSIGGGGSGARLSREVRVAAVSALLALAALTFGAAPALAATQWNLDETFATGHAGSWLVAVPGYPRLGGQLAIDNSTNPADPSAGDIYLTTSHEGEIGYEGEVSKYTALHASEGQINPDAQIKGMTKAFGVAVDPANGNAYVNDFANGNIVKKYDASGNQLFGFQLDSSIELVQPGPIAVSPTTGNVFVANIYRYPFSKVFELTPDGSSTGNIYQAPREIEGLAVDSADNVYAVLSNGPVIKFTEPGDVFTTFTTETNAGYETDRNPAAGVAINPADQHVFINGPNGAAEYDPSGTRLTDFFGPGGSGIGVDRDGSHVYLSGGRSNDAPAGVYLKTVVPDAEAHPATAITRVSATLHGHVDPAGAGNISDCILEYISDADFTLPDPNTTEIDQLTVAATSGTFVLGFKGQESSPVAFDAAPTTLRAALEGFSGIGAGNVSVTGGPGDEAGSSPYVITFTGSLSHKNVSDVSVDGTGLTGPAPAAYAETIAQGHGMGFGEAAQVPCSEGTAFAAPVDVSAEIAGLAAATIYHFRVAATGPGGTKHSLEQTLKTESIADVKTGEATDIQPTTATLNGTLDPNGATTTYHYEYTTDATYKTNVEFFGSGFVFGAASVPVPDGDAGSTPGSQPVPIAASGLSPETVYHYRLVGTNSFGSEVGSEKSFTTLSALGLDLGTTTNITKNSATLHATINSRGSQPSDCHFEYVPDGTFNQVQILTVTRHAFDQRSLNFSYNGIFGKEFVSLTFPADPALVEAAVASIPTIKPGNVQVTGPVGGPFRIQFVGKLAGASLAKLGVSIPDSASIVGGQWQGAASVPCTPDAISIPGDFNEHPVSADVAGLLGNHVYHVRLLATNGNGSSVSGDGEFRTDEVAPTATTGPGLTPGPESVELTGSANPFGIQGSFYFEYGATAAYGSRSSEGVLGNGHAVLSVSRVIHGLQPSTEYHYRLVAVNAIGTAQGDDRTFTTENAPSPSGRAYEQVTPVEKRGVELETFGAATPFRASLDGNAIRFEQLASFPGPRGVALFSENIASRRAGTWQTTNTDLPFDNLPNSGDGFPQAIQHTTLAVSDDLRHALVVSNRVFAPGAVAGTENLYRTGVADGSLELLVAGDQTLGNLGGFHSKETPIGASSDLRTFVYLGANDRMVAAGIGEPTRIASILPNGTPTKPKISWAFGNYRDVHQVSNDGSKVYWDDDDGGPTLGGPKYLRLNPTQSESAHGATPTATGDLVAASKTVGNFQSSQGSFVAGAEVFGPGIPDGATIEGTGAGTLILSKAATKSGSVTITSVAPCTEPSKACTVRLPGSFIAASPDGHLAKLSSATGPLIYNADTGIATGLSTMSPAAREEVFAAGGIARMYDSAAIQASGLTNALNERPLASEISASPNGRYLSYFTTKQLTPYDNSGKAENYLYDVQEHLLACASCRRDGGAPSGGAFSNYAAFTDQTEHWWPRSVLDDGTVLFTTPDPLVSADINNLPDVYSYRGGKVTLISPGVGPASTFREVSPGGSDIFFTTFGRLVAQDTDSDLDLYDARLGGGIPTQNVLPTPECVGADCRAAAVPSPATPTVGSKSVTGPGNPNARMKKHSGKRRKRRHPKKHAKVEHRASRNGGGAK